MSPGGPQGYRARGERLHGDNPCDATTTHVGGGVVIAADLSGSCLACYIALRIPDAVKRGKTKVRALSRPGKSPYGPYGQIQATINKSGVLEINSPPCRETSLSGSR